MGRPGRSKEERDEEFIAAVEQLLGFPLMGYQKPYLLYIRQASLSGKKIDLDVIRFRRLEEGNLGR